MDRKDYISILKEKESLNERVTYSDKLSSFEWIQKRKLILKRDNSSCTKCGSKPSKFFNGEYFRNMTKEEEEKYKKEYYEEQKKSKIGKASFETLGFYLKPAIPNKKVEKPVILQIHHKYYINNKLPWEYLDDALITLCQDCHQNLHKNDVVPVYINEQKLTLMDLTPCKRCNGSGYLKEFHYYKNGICFHCFGEKYEEFVN